MTLMTGGRTAGGGSRVRPMAEGSARGPRVRASTPAPGVTASRSWACTRGPAGTATRAPGRRASGMASAWRARAAGSTEGSGRRGSKVATGSWRARPAGPGTRGRGATGCRMDTALKPTPTEVRQLKLNHSRCGVHVSSHSFCLRADSAQFDSLLVEVERLAYC